MIAVWIFGALTGLGVYHFHRKVSHMSASLDRLKSAVSSVVSRVSALEAQVANPPVTGTPDAELDALSTQLEALVTPAPVTLIEGGAI